MENVPQFLRSFEHGEIMGMTQAMGFKVWGSVLCSGDYGVPQTRCCAIINCKFLDPATMFPPRTLIDPLRNGTQTSFLQADPLLVAV